MTDPDEDLYGDFSYRAGVLIGRRQSLTEIRDRLVSPDCSRAEAVVAAVGEWCAQTEHELDVELQLVILAQQKRTQ